jgi:pyruvate, water dikinase
VEFTANFRDESAYHINLLQCRPLQVKGAAGLEAPLDAAPEGDVILRSCGPVIGHSRAESIERIVYVAPERYAELHERERYAVARLIGQIMQRSTQRQTPVTLLMGPGRWGTSSPVLGIPVSFAEISGASILCEIVAMRDDLVPDVSMGTHFLSELIEMDILYVAVFPNNPEHALDCRYFESRPNRLLDAVPDATRFQDVVQVVFPAEDNGRAVKLHADTLKQQVVCYLAAEKPGD